MPTPCCEHCNPPTHSTPHDIAWLNAQSRAASIRDALADSDDSDGLDDLDLYDGFVEPDTPFYPSDRRATDYDKYL